MPSKWIEFVKKWAKDNNITYGRAMSQPECKNAYHKESPSTPKPVKQEDKLPDIKRTDPVWEYSNPIKVAKNAKKYFGDKTPVFVSADNRKKKYYVYTPEGKKKRFGEMGMEDFTKHNDPVRRDNYLSRATNIKGKWKEDKFSPNNLAINLLWS